MNVDTYLKACQGLCRSPEILPRGASAAVSCSKRAHATSFTASEVVGSEREVNLRDMSFNCILPRLNCSHNRHLPHVDLRLPSQLKVNI